MELIVNNISEILYKNYKIILEVNNEDFINIFSIISQTISEKELKKNKNIKKDYINDKIIKEVIKFLLSKKEEMLEKKIIKQVKIIESTTTSEPIKFKQSLLSNENNININVFVENIHIKDIYIIGTNYNINKYNNVIVIKEKIDSLKEIYTDDKIIIIEPGNYTTSSLIKELNLKFTNKDLSHKYYFYTDDITNKLCITTINLNESDINLSNPIISKLKLIKDENKMIFEINFDKSTILPLLGFNKSQNLKGNNIYTGSSSIKINNIDLVLLNFKINAENDFDNRQIDMVIKKNNKNYFYIETLFKDSFTQPIFIKDLCISIKDMEDCIVYYTVEYVYFIK